jgi:DNA-binding response OmpR family regulator
VTPNALPRLCVLDDEEGIRRQLVNFLEDFDEFEVIAADSAEQALRLLEETPAAVSLVDVRLPGSHGLDFILQARQRGLCRHFLLHTGSLDMDLSPELEALGLSAQDIFHKPADLAALLERIRALLKS